MPPPPLPAGRGSSGPSGCSIYFVAVFHRSEPRRRRPGRGRPLRHLAPPSWRRSRCCSCWSTPACRCRWDCWSTATARAPCCSSGTLLLTLAQAGFALAETYPLALLARVFVGMGDAMTFICVLRLVSSWFPPRRIPLRHPAHRHPRPARRRWSPPIPMTWALGHLGWTRAYLLAASVGVRAGARRAGRAVHDSPGGAAPARPAPVAGARCGTAWRPRGRTPAPGWASGCTSRPSSAPPR